MTEQRRVCTCGACVARRDVAKLQEAIRRVLADGMGVLDEDDYACTASFPVSLRKQEVCCD